MNDTILRQLTAYVDGELSPAETDAVNNLLRESAEARELLRKLQRDQERLRALEREQSSIDFSFAVVDLILRRKNPARARRRFIPRLAVAASLLLALGLGGYFLKEHLSKARGPGPIAATGQPAAPPAPPGIAERSAPDAAKSPAVALDELHRQLPSREQLNEALEQLREALSPLADQLARIYQSSQEAVASAIERESGEAGGAGEPGLGNPTILTSQMRPGKAFKSIEMSKLPPIFDVKDFDSGKLVALLKEERVHHIDLSCQECGKALERLQAACRASGVKLIVDAEVTQRLNQKLPAPYMVYLENVSPELVAKVLDRLRLADQRAEQAKKGDAQFGSVLVLPLDEAGRKRLASSLGVSSSSLLPAKVKKPGPASKIDPTQPISKETEKALDKLAAGQGRGAGNAPTAVVLISVPNRKLVPVSKEVKAYLDGRSGAQADHVNVVFFLRAGRL
jgi:hypothetical protein